MAQLDAPAEKNLKFLAAILALAGCVALAISPWVMRADVAISASVRGGHVPGDLRKAIELSEAFAHGTGAFVILLAVLLVSSRPRAAIGSAILMTALSGISANALKATFTRARPYTYDAQKYDAQKEVVPDVTGWEFLGTGSFWDASQRSFPSGHTATAWGLAIGLSLLFPRGCVLFVLLAMLATYQRLYSGAHFPSDTVAGFGVACLACSIVLFVPRLRRSFLIASPSAGAP